MSLIFAERPTERTTAHPYIKAAVSQLEARMSKLAYGIDELRLSMCSSSIHGRIRSGLYYMPDIKVVVHVNFC